MTQLSGGLTFGAANLKQHMAGWSYGESSNGFIPAYKLESKAALVAELVASGEWVAIIQEGITYGYDIAVEDGAVIFDATVHDDEAELTINEALTVTAEVEVMTGHKDDPQAPSEALQKIIDAVPHHELRLANQEPRQQIREGFSDDELEDGFDDFLDAYASAANSDRLFKAFSQAAKRTLSITKLIEAAEEYSTQNNRPALRWLNDDEYLATSVFQPES